MLDLDISQDFFFVSHPRMFPLTPCVLVRYPVIYAGTSWWDQCTGSSAAFASTNPLWLADWSSVIGPLPAGWSYPTFWQYADSGPHPGDQDLFNGDEAGLQKMALG